MTDEQKSKITKEWLENQIRSAEAIINQNEGIRRFCLALIERGMYAKTETDEGVN